VREIESAGARESLIAVPAGVYRESVTTSGSLHFVGGGKATISPGEQEGVRIFGGTSTFEGFAIVQADSQAYPAVAVLSGTAVFRDCRISSHFTSAVLLKDGGRAVFINCEISSTKGVALQIQDDAVVFAQNCVFRSTERTAILARRRGLVHLRGCRFESQNPSVNGVRFTGESQFLFENARICQPFSLESIGDFTVIRNCDIDTLNLKVSGRCLFHTCRFNQVTLEVNENSGVRVIASQFIGGKEEPALRVVRSTVELNECAFSNAESAAAVFVTNNSLLGVTDSVFHDVAHSAILALEPPASSTAGGDSDPKVELRVTASRFGNIGGSGIVAKGISTISVEGSLFNRVRGSGLVLVNAKSASIRGSQFSHSETQASTSRIPEANNPLVIILSSRASLKRTKVQGFMYPVGNSW
jgi:hypothetical protein